MTVLDTLFSTLQYSLARDEKEILLLDELSALCDRHRMSCDPYRLMLEALPPADILCLADVPFIPVRLFKKIDLRSIQDSAVMKVLTSSGTTSQQVARIALDRETALLQTKALASIITSFIGQKRLPMIIVDSRSTLQNRSSLSARAAGLVGLSNFGRNHFYALDDHMRLDLPGLREFAEQNGKGPILIFGFTFMVWQYLVAELSRLGESISLEQGILIHGGGWKKLKEQAVGNDVFKEALRDRCGIRKVYNYYGMVEQVGSIYMECEHGFMHAPNFAEILIRNPQNWKVLPPESTGVIETISVLPRSYPGHALLTEDMGTVHGVDDCPCGRLGTRFTVEGRLPRAELRGCSDTHAYGVLSDNGSGGVTLFLPLRREGAGLDDVPGDAFFNQELLPAFSDPTIAFLDALSQTIFALTKVLDDPDLVALAYWLRRSNISSYVRDFKATVSEYELVVPRGTAFHVAPANVETIFLYSWAVSLLAGNRNVVRLPQGISPRLITLLDSIRGLLDDPKWSEINKRNVILSYPRDDEFNRFFSSRADIRVIWGGDETVLHFRGLPAKPTVKDVVFADKISYSLVQTCRYLALSEEEASETARLFRNDAYQFDQMACSSPRIVYFIGTEDECVRASRRFWDTLRRVVLMKGGSSAEVSMNKLVVGCEVVALGCGGHFPYGLPDGGPTVVRVDIGGAALRTNCGGGFFFECFAAGYKELVPLVQGNDQTLTYVGFNRNEMKEISSVLCVRGIDRIVPVGRALDFSPVWDGYVLFSELTRRVSIR